ncbi:MAG: hypothetical protein R2717_09875 [Schumannella sp.]
MPMNRLVQGEVGSGKTVVALRAMLAVADSGRQSGLAPTEVLAGQHLRSLVAALGPDLAARLRPTLLTGRLPPPIAGAPCSRPHRAAPRSWWARTRSWATR